MSHPLITIVTVTYNAAKVLKPTLDSVMSQTFRDYEHLIIDGNSKDNTLDLAKATDNPRLRIICEPDKGLYDAMNKALDKAEGNYVIFLNAGDTFSSPDILMKYGEEAKRGKDIIYGDTLIVNQEREIISKRHLSAPETLTDRSFQKGMLICHQAFMVKTALCEPFDLKYRFSADYDWCVRCIKKSDKTNCANLHIATIHYLSDGLTDKNKIKSLKERFRIMSYHYGLIPTLWNHFLFLFRALRRKF